MNKTKFQNKIFVFCIIRLLRNTQKVSFNRYVHEHASLTIFYFNRLNNSNEALIINVIRVAMAVHIMIN